MNQRWIALLPLWIAAGCCGSPSSAPPATAPGAAPATASPAPSSGAPAAVAPAATAPAATAPAGGTVPAEQLEYRESKVTVDATTGDPKEDAFRYIHVWGEMRNGSSQWVQQIAGDIRYFGPDGQELQVDSIATAVKQDVGDRSPGERIGTEVDYIPPGGSAPFHHIRALGKLAGKYGSHKVALRPATVVTRHPDVTFTAGNDRVAEVANPTLTNPTPNLHRVISGTLRNQGTLGCRDPGLVVGFYDAAGKLTDLSSGQASQDVSKVLEPGAELPVEVYTLVGFEDAWKQKATIRTWVSCKEPY